MSYKVPKVGLLVLPLHIFIIVDLHIPLVLQNIYKDKFFFLRYSFNLNSNASLTFTLFTCPTVIKSFKPL